MSKLKKEITRVHLKQKLP